MAIIDTTRKPFLVDNDDTVFIGIDLPIRRGNDVNGYFASTSTTIEAVKNNIRNLLNTHRGERLMQPSLGIPLRRFLFEQINEEVIVELENEIENTLSFWLPFVQIKEMKITTNNTDKSVDQNNLLVNIVFSIKEDPNTLASVQLQISGMAATGQSTIL